MWDTTIRIETPNEILFTYGHEQGHYVLHHVAKGIAFAAVLIFGFYWIAFRLLRWLVRTRGTGWGIDAVESWSSLGLVLLLAMVLGFLAEPIGNAFSRAIEHQADVYGQEVIHGLVPDAQAATVSSFCSDAMVWLDDPAPNRFVELWTYSHPFDGGARRVRCALRSVATGADAAVFLKVVGGFTRDLRRPFQRFRAPNPLPPSWTVQGLPDVDAALHVQPEVGAVAKDA